MTRYFVFYFINRSILNSLSFCYTVERLEILVFIPFSSKQLLRETMFRQIFVTYICLIVRTERIKTIVKVED